MLMEITLHELKQLAARKHEGKRMILNKLDTQFLKFLVPPLKLTVPSGCLFLFSSASACASTFNSFIFIVIPCIAFAVGQCDVPISFVANVCMLFLFLLF